MRSVFFLLILLMVASPVHADQPFGRPFQLGVGESVTLGRGQVSVGFADLVSDSRCPVGVSCFWEGDAAVGLWLREAVSVSQEFVLHTFADFQGSLELGPYTISLLAVEPYPIFDVVPDPDTQFVKLVVHTGTAGAENRAWGLVKALYR